MKTKIKTEVSNLRQNSIKSAKSKSTKYKTPIICHNKNPIVSDRNLAILVRQVALHCNLAAEIQRSVTAGREPRASNWLERLRAIKRIREKVILDLESQERGHGSGNEISAGIWAVIQR